MAIPNTAEATICNTISREVRVPLSAISCARYSLMMFSPSLCSKIKVSANGPARTVFADRKLAGGTAAEHILDVAQQKAVLFYLQHHQRCVGVLGKCAVKNVDAALHSRDMVVKGHPNLVLSGDKGSPAVFHYGAGLIAVDVHNGAALLSQRFLERQQHTVIPLS